MTELTEQEKRDRLHGKLEKLSANAGKKGRAHLVNLRDELVPYLPDDLEQYHGLTITNGNELLRQSKTHPARMTMRTL